MTLLELIGILFLVVLVLGTLTYTFLAILRATDEQQSRTESRAGLTLRLEEVVREIRPSKQMRLEGNHAVRYTLREGNQDKNYILYLFNPNDTFPPAFNQDSYELRKAELTGGINGTFAYGDGSLFLKNIAPPPASTVSFSSRQITFEYTAKVKSSQIKLRTSVRARNFI
jgi:hypothetical protein